MSLFSLQEAGMNNHLIPSSIGRTEPALETCFYLTAHANLYTSCS